MNICDKNPNRTAPEKEAGTSPPADLPQCSRTNGWSWPPHPFQLLAWLLYIYFAVIGFGIFIPLLPTHWVPAGYIHTFFFFFYVWNRLSTYAYIMRQRHRHEAPSTRVQNEGKETLPPKMNPIKDVGYSGTLGYTNPEIQVEDPAVIVASGKENSPIEVPETGSSVAGRPSLGSAIMPSRVQNSQSDSKAQELKVETHNPAVATLTGENNEMYRHDMPISKRYGNGTLRKSSSSKAGEEPRPIISSEQQQQQQPARRTSTQVSSTLTDPSFFWLAGPPFGALTVAASQSLVLPVPVFPQRASLPPLVASAAPVQAAGPPADYNSDSAESMDEIPVAQTRLGSAAVGGYASNSRQNLLSKPRLPPQDHRPLQPLPSPQPRAMRRSLKRPLSTEQKFKLLPQPPTVYVSKSSGDCRVPQLRANPTAVEEGSSGHSKWKRTSKKSHKYDSSRDARTAVLKMAESTDMSLLQEAFKKFSIHGDTKATGKELNGKNWAKLCKDCKIIDGKSVTSTDVDIVFSKVK
ncbi:UNVERIFIED_CONTAM: hypothetical protein FKN15_028516 [Acipenser sinensis]